MISCVPIPEALPFIGMFGPLGVLPVQIDNSIPGSGFLFQGSDHGKQPVFPLAIGVGIRLDHDYISFFQQGLVVLVTKKLEFFVSKGQLPGQEQKYRQHAIRTEGFVELEKLALDPVFDRGCGADDLAICGKLVGQVNEIRVDGQDLFGVSSGRFLNAASYLF